MKIALCFIISGKHIVNKEKIWLEWIEPNKDIINVYFHYKDFSLIQSEWIKKNALPKKYISETSYYHMVLAYMTTMNYAYKDKDKENTWFFLLTESCVPIISPSKMRSMFFDNYNYSIMRWKHAWWNVDYHKRANLRFLPEKLHLGNDPWFVLKREHLELCNRFLKERMDTFKLICDGGLANESIFAIILKYYGELETAVISEVVSAADWSKMSSATSPYVFTNGSHEDVAFIHKFISDNKYTMFLRKVSHQFPDNILLNFIKTNSETI